MTLPVTPNEQGSTQQDGSLNVLENAQFVCSRLVALAASTGASVIVSRYFAKREASTPEQAREAIRGTGGRVDGLRSVHALWNPKEDQAKAICKALGEPFERDGVVMAAWSRPTVAPSCG